MLDLNVDENTTCVQKGLQHVNFPPEILDYSKICSPFIFDLLKKENTAQTMTLFPVSADRGGRVLDSMIQKQSHQVRKNRRGPRSRSSQYRGVTFYRRTGRWESHIWDCGKQVYLGGFDTAHAAARVYDRAAIMFRGVDADINFSLSDYEEDLKQMKGLSKEEFVLRLRRQNNGISRTSSTFKAAFALKKYGQGDPHITQFAAKTFFHDSPIKSHHKGEIIGNCKKEGTLHNLDLSLRISPSSKQLNNNDSRFMASIIPKRMTTTENGLVNMSDSKKEVPLQVFCNNGRGNIASGCLLSNAAASSGFLSSSSSSSILSLSQPQCYTYHHQQH